jgi:hypothetical protein
MAFEMGLLGSLALIVVLVLTFRLYDEWTYRKVLKKGCCGKPCDGQGCD